METQEKTFAELASQKKDYYEFKTDFEAECFAAYLNKTGAAAEFHKGICGHEKDTGEYYDQAPFVTAEYEAKTFTINPEEMPDISPILAETGPITVRIFNGNEVDAVLEYSDGVFQYQFDNSAEVFHYGTDRVEHETEHVRITGEWARHRFLKRLHEILGVPMPA